MSANIQWYGVDVLSRGAERMFGFTATGSAIDLGSYPDAGARGQALGLEPLVPALDREWIWPDGTRRSYWLPSA